MGVLRRVDGWRSRVPVGWVGWRAGFVCVVWCVALLVVGSAQARVAVTVPANTSPLIPLVTTIDVSQGVKISCSGKIVYGTLPTRYSSCSGPVGLLYRAGTGAFKKMGATPITVKGKGVLSFAVNDGLTGCPDCFADNSGTYSVTVTPAPTTKPAPATGGALAVPKVVVPAGKVLKASDKGAAVEELQRALAALGLYKGKIDGTFGKDLTAAVIAYQKSKGMAADGVVGPKVAAAVNTSVAAPGKIVLPGGKALGSGDSGEAVVDIQKALAALGLYKGKVDGVFGKDLVAALARYQASKGLTADGRVGPKTATLLNASVAAPEKIVVPPGQTLSKSDSGAAVTELQRTLAALGLYKGKVDGVFGNDLAAAVAAYQKSKGLTPDGTVGNKMAALISASAAAPAKIIVSGGQTLSTSDSGTAVEELQRALTALGLYKGPLDGVFGKNLSAAVATYQTSKGLTADGTVGAKTAAMINASVATPEKVVVAAGRSLSLSDSGANVEALQKSLAALGLYKGRMDGVFGKDLQASVITFAKSNGLPADGTVGPAAAAKINAAAK